MKLKTKLKKFETTNRLERYVVDYILGRYNDNQEIKDFSNDLLSHGCVSDMIDELVYYEDTHKFYEKFYNEIEELRIDHEENIGEPIEINGDLKNFFAWFGFEQTASKIADKLDLND
jgi:hypothetical protein